MQPPSTLLLSTGEFARMCNVSKELLIHYDKVGLLKPKVIGKNGYRYYSLKQLYLMDAIRFFLDTGMSMKEVKTYLDNRTTDLFLEATQAGIEKMKKQRDVLDARIGMIEKMRYITQRALLFPKDKPRLSFWDETWLITTDVKPLSLIHILVATPMPMPFVTAVVTARVGHRPSIWRSVGFSMSRPLLNTESAEGFWSMAAIMLLPSPSRLRRRQAPRRQRIDRLRWPRSRRPRLLWTRWWRP